MGLANITIKQAHEGLEKKEFSALELANNYLEKIEKKDKNINAFLTVCQESAVSQAKKIDEKIAKKEKLDFLAGVPCAIKDIILVDGVRCTAASKMLENYIAPYDATAVKKIKIGGAVILGKTNLDEFAMGASGENSAFGPTKNPHDLTRVPGGTSSGSAAAVAADMAVYSLGSDTGGSIRYPASFCGVVGLRPTYGAVSRYGQIAMTSSLDQIGPLAKTVEDCEIIFNAIKGKDELDSTSVEMPEFDNWKLEVKNLRVGVPKEYFIKGIDERVEKIIRNAIKKYEDAGARVEEISLPNTEYAVPAYYIIVPSEISANLSRYDGIKYGFSENTGSLLDVYMQSRGKGLGSEVKRRIMLGTYALSAGYHDAYYLRAQKIRTLIREDFNEAFKHIDVIMAPVSPFPAFKIGEKVEDPLLMYLCDIFTASVSLAGLPAISIPAGKINNLPVGLQIIGKHFEENKILEVGKFFEDIV